MRVLIILAIVGLAASQRFRTHNPFQFGGQQQQRQQPRQQQSSGLVHDALGSSVYHYSFRTGRSPMDGRVARQYCQRLGGGWHGIDINDPSENNYVTRVLEGEKRYKYFWTGGFKQGRSFVWSDGSRIGFSDWSHTGGLDRPQPDNRDGDENCLGVLQDVYQDGIKWHDVGCHHKKHIICERRA